MSVKQKKRGRPDREGSRLSCEAIVTGAKELMLRDNKKISIRALANHLDIDPMAIYHYFANKAALLEAITVSIMEDIYQPKVSDNWREEILALCYSYMTLLNDHPGLLETILSMSGVEAPAEVFRSRFRLAMTVLQLDAEQEETAIHLLVDYLHGFALALNCVADKSALKFSDLERPLNLYFHALEKEG